MDVTGQLRQLSEDIGCGIPLAYDLLLMAGGNEELVREASARCVGLGSVKTYIFCKRLDELVEEIEGRNRGNQTREQHGTDDA